MKDLKVIELASVLAGPSVGMFFAELGASVVKIENKTTGGDVTRQWKLPSENPEAPQSAYWCSVNWGKKILLKDLNDAADRQEVLDLIRDADVLISNFRGAAAARLGMDPDSLRKMNTRLVVGCITGFPEGDPRPAYDVVLQAEAGFLYMNGEPGRQPVKMPVALIDLLAAHQLKEGILLALWERERSGKGATVSVSLLEAAIASLANQATNWLMAGHIPSRMGNLHPNIAPYGEIFHCADDCELVLAVGNDKQFALLCEVLGLPHLATDERFATNQARLQHRQALMAALTPAFRQCHSHQLLDRLVEAGVPAARIRNMAQVFEMPVAKQMILEDELPDGSVGRRVRTVAFFREEG